MSGSTSHLDQLPIGAAAVVRSVDCDRLVRRRLLELGLLPGTEVAIVRRAPLGDPLELSVRGYRLSIRADEARSVGVERLPSAAPAATETLVTRRV